MFNSAYSLIGILKNGIEIVHLIKSNVLYILKKKNQLIKHENNLKKLMSPTPGIEPGPARWKPAILAIRPRGILVESANTNVIHFAWFL